VLLPVICIWAFLWDGVFMGAVRTRTLRNAMAGSVLIYVPTLYALSALWGNHGIWAALTVFMAVRSILLTLAWPALKASVVELGVAQRPRSAAREASP
jgi:MATE family multidrug resistance protein